MNYFGDIMNKILETIGKYDTVRGMNRNKKTITIQDVLDNKKIEYYPECCPEYMAIFEVFDNNTIIKTTIDMSRKPIKKVKYLHY